MLRGKVDVSDVRRNIERLHSSLHFVHWNQQGWKTGLCSIPPIGQVSVHFNHQPIPSSDGEDDLKLLECVVVAYQEINYSHLIVFRKQI